MKRVEVSIIIPAFNEGRAIEAVLQDVINRFGNDRFEVIVVNDGSADDTAEVARRFPVRVISHKSNRGYGAAVKTGIHNARGDIVAFMDSDSQHSSKYLEAILETLS